MRIGIFQDIHANLPALKKSLEVFKEKKCDRIYHVGDLIGIGPHPKEVFELVNSLDNIVLIMGNHDYWFAYGIPFPRPKLMSKEELAHQEWTHLQIGPDKRPIVKKWNFVEELKINERNKITFAHYGYDSSKNWFKNFIPKPTTADLDEMFNEFDSDIIFYGHNHDESDIQGSSRYINLGSTGCYSKAEVRLGILDIINNKVELAKITAPYDDSGLMEDFELRKVPARNFIKQNFITRDRKRQ